MIEKLEANIQESQKHIEELRIYIGKYGNADPPAQDTQTKRFDGAPTHLLDIAIGHQKYQRAILELIKNEDAEHIPSYLATLYLPCSTKNCRNKLPYWEIEDAIIAFGAPALQPLLDRFSALDNSRKRHVLKLLLQIEPMLCPINVLDTALAEHDFPLRSTSLSIYRRNCSSEVFHRKLYLLFANETDPEFLEYLLEQMPKEIWNHPPTYNRLLQLTQEQRIPFYRGIEIVCSLYGFTSTSHSYWNAIYGADREFLDLFRKHLRTDVLNSWRQAADASPGEKLLLSQWLGEDPLNLLSKKLRLQLEVRTPTNAVVSSGTVDTALAQPFDFSLDPFVSDFPKIRYRGTVYFNSDKLNYAIQEFHLTFPAEPGAIFDAEVPLSGHFETDLILQQQHRYRWKIRLLPMDGL